MECNVNIEYMHTKLFKNYASFTEKAKCAECEYEKITELTNISLLDYEMNFASIDNAITNSFERDKSDCGHCKKKKASDSVYKKLV